MCPGDTMSFLFLLLLIATDIVCALSAADIPVVTPSLASIEISVYPLRISCSE